MATTGLLESWSPWPSRSSTPKLGTAKGEGPNPTPSVLQQGVDHSLRSRYRFSQRDYPPDCPNSQIQWYYAVDVPKKKPIPLDQSSKDAPPTIPKKYVAFSARDSRAIETAFRRLAEAEDDSNQRDHQDGDLGDVAITRARTTSNAGQSLTVGTEDLANTITSRSSQVPVNEDFLFDVDIEKRELAPTYWLGPVYDVRRGSWFHQEGSNLRPCDENLANQLEEGYVKTKPWRYDNTSMKRSSSQTRPGPLPTNPDEVVSRLGGSTTPLLQTKSSIENLKIKANGKDSATAIPAKFQLQTQRLFGSHMNSVVTYQDATVAWILTDDLLSRMSSTVYQRFAGGGHLGGAKVVRGFVEASKAKDKKPEQEPLAGESKSGPSVTPKDQKRKSAPAEINISVDPSKSKETKNDQKPSESSQQESKLAALQREVSNIVTSPELEDPVKQDEQARKGDEDEMQEDYKEADGDDPGREIQHLILVTHGIGQRLGMRVENLNFIRDVNKLRKTLKSVYEKSPDLQALNNELDKLPKNCRVQVLPVVWRHLLDFPKQSFKQNGKEQDLTDAFGEEEKYPSLNDITVEGVPGIRNLITDLALDILLYQSAYREHIAGIVQRECNRIYELFVQRNPTFNGKVSLIGHSLGSAILFDILCRQKGPEKSGSAARNRRHSRRVGSMAGQQEQTRDLSLKFEVENFFCLGSPLGLYQMLKGRKIAARDDLHGLVAESSLETGGPTDDPFLSGPSTTIDPPTATDSDLLTITVSSPKCNQLFNIFHPADAIAYRLEPLISPAMSALRPQPLPYTKKGMFPPGQGFTGIPARVGQSVSGFWSNITSGVANSLLNRSLGITGEGQTQAQAPSQSSLPAPIFAHVAATSATPRTVTDVPAIGSNSDAGSVATNDQQHPPTLIDGEIETLYAGFQNRRRSQQSDDGRDLGERPEWQDADARAKKLQREEAKVRALNSNGRVDFQIQESVFDINNISLIGTIASHLSYWDDEDCAHFMISQLLARQRVVVKR